MLCFAFAFACSNDVLHHNNFFPSLLHRIRSERTARVTNRVYKDSVGLKFAEEYLSLDALSKSGKWNYMTEPERRQTLKRGLGPMKYCLGL